MNTDRETILKEFDKIIALMVLKTKAIKILLIVAALEFSVILILASCLVGASITK